MKQLVIGKGTYSSLTDYNNLVDLEEGAIGLYNLSTGELITSSAELVNNFVVVTGRKEGLVPRHFSEVDVKTLTVQKAEYTEGSIFSASITIPETEKGKEYTVIVAKCGTVFNERNKWTFSSVAKGTSAEDVATDLVKRINANTISSGVKAENSGAALTITAVKEGDNYELVGADELFGVEVTINTKGVNATLDKAYIQDLASRCAAGKGFNYLAEDGKEIYPGYPEEVSSDKYVLYSLRFAVPRVSAKQRDEVVYQTLHIAIPEDGAAVSTLDSMFGTTTATGAAEVSEVNEDDENTGV